MSAARPCGLVDIGSNSVVLLIASRVGDDWTVLERVKHSVRLGAAIDPSGQLAPAGVLRLQAALADLLSQAQAYSAPLRVTATASLRNVTNGAAIAAELGEQLGCSIEILSEKAEASAAFRGVWDAEGRGAQPMVVVDVGGGSSEVGWGARGVMQGWLSLPIGGVRLSAPHQQADPVTPSDVNAMRRTLGDQIESLSLTAPGVPEAYACSGSIRRLCAMAGSQDDRLSCDDLDRVIDRLERAGWRAERLALPGVDPGRVDVLLGAALIHQALARRFAWGGFRLSRGGLRWGLLSDGFSQPLSL
ncbi:MAG: hypothetical protein VYB65_00595 [Myxococcota bacterium]|nr:hypothetical protein [Myxococcota bacterium]